MRQIRVFETISLDGFFTDDKNDMSWAHKHDDEWTTFSSSNASGEAELLFGRITYEMMAAFWPSPQAAQMLPEVAKGMNRMKKYAVSRTLKDVSWQGTTILKGDLVSEAKRLKQQSGPDLLILGSGSIVSQLADARLVDEYQIVLSPIVLGHGRTLFETVKGKQPLALHSTRQFKNGNVVLSYVPFSKT
jgi:dihydrofolate reductase